MDVRVLVAGEPYIANLPSAPRLDTGIHGAALGKDLVRVVESNDLVMLKKVDMTHPQPLEGLVELAAASFFVRPSTFVITNAFSR
jgi:hypothetical protein